MCRGIDLRHRVQMPRHFPFGIPASPLKASRSRESSFLFTRIQNWILACAGMTGYFLNSL